jgi:hypothetical protein
MISLNRALALFAVVFTTLSGYAETTDVLSRKLYETRRIPDPFADQPITSDTRWEIYWQDTPATDGAFTVVVHPMQIILRSGHNNPNPNYIYWFADLKPGQYKAICAALDNYKSGAFSDKDVWTSHGYKGLRLTRSKTSPWYQDEEPKEWEWKCANVLRDNTNAVLAELNRILPRGVEKLKPLHIMDLLGYRLLRISGTDASFMPSRKPSHH